MEMALGFMGNQLELEYGRKQVEDGSAVGHALGHDDWRELVRLFVKESCPAAVKSRIRASVFRRTRYRLPSIQKCPDHARMSVQQRTVADMQRSNHMAIRETRQCVAFTRCRVARLPSSNLQYFDVDTGRVVPPKEYEKRYYKYLDHLEKTAMQLQAAKSSNHTTHIEATTSETESDEDKGRGSPDIQVHKTDSEELAEITSTKHRVVQLQAQATSLTGISKESVDQDGQMQRGQVSKRTCAIEATQLSKRVRVQNSSGQESAFEPQSNVKHDQITRELQEMPPSKRVRVLRSEAHESVSELQSCDGHGAMTREITRFITLATCESNELAEEHPKHGRLEQLVC